MIDAKIVRAADLVPDAKNANKGTERGLGMLDDSLRKYGAGRSILVDKNGQVIAGNKTLERAVDVGIADAGIIVVETDGTQLVAVQRTDLDINDPRARELAVADNRVSQIDLEWDPTVLVDLTEGGAEIAGMWSEDEWAAIQAAANPLPSETRGIRDDVDPDEIPADAPTRCQPGDLWRLGEHMLYCADSTVAANVERLLEGHKATCCWTDPPYLMGFDGSVTKGGEKAANSKSGTIENEQLTGEEGNAFVRSYFCIIRDFCDGAYYVCHSRRHFAQVFSCAEMVRANPRYHLIWVKNNHSLSGADYMSRYEGILYGWCGSTERVWLGGRNQFDILEHDRPRASDTHPTTKPVSLVEECLLNSSNSGDIVLDLFTGSGTTLIACQKIGRVFRGLELSPRFCDVILQRWEAATGGTAERAE